MVSFLIFTVCGIYIRQYGNFYKTFFSAQYIEICKTISLFRGTKNINIKKKMLISQLPNQIDFL